MPRPEPWRIDSERRALIRIRQQLVQTQGQHATFREVELHLVLVETLDPLHLEVAERTDRPGVATGLAWTPTGGDVLFVEATMMPSQEERLILTGMLGDVMRESVSAAYSYVRSRAEMLEMRCRVRLGGSSAQAMPESYRRMRHANESRVSS